MFLEWNIKYRTKMIILGLFFWHLLFSSLFHISTGSRQNKNQPQFRSEYNVYSTFQSHEPEFDYLKSLEIEEKINKIRWLPQKNAAQFLLSTNGKFDFNLAHIQIFAGSLWCLFVLKLTTLFTLHSQMLIRTPVSSSENIM